MSDGWEDVPTRGPTLTDRAKQLFAGTRETFLNSPQAVKELGPVAWPVPGGVWQLLGVGEMATDALGLTDPSRNTLGEYGRSAQEAGNEFAQTGDPKDWIDTLLRFAPNMLVGGGGAGAKAAATGIGKGASYVGKVLAPILPLRQSTTVKGALAEMGVGTGASDVIADVSDPTYEGGVIPMLTSAWDTARQHVAPMGPGLDLTPVAAQPPGITPPAENAPSSVQPSSPDTSKVYMADTGTPNATVQSVSDPGAVQAATPRSSDGWEDVTPGGWEDVGWEDAGPAPGSQWSNMQKGLMIAGGVLGAGALARYGVGRAARAITGTPEPGAEARVAREGLAAPSTDPNFVPPANISIDRQQSSTVAERVGKRIKDADVKGVWDDITQSVADRNQPVYNAAKRNMSEEEYQQLYADITSRITPHASHSRVSAAIDQGILPNSQIKFNTPIIRTMNAYADLSPDEARLVDDALIAGTRMDDMQGKPGAVWGGYRYSDLEQIQRVADANPRVKQIVQEVRDFHKTLTRYGVEQEIVDLQDYLATRGNTRYVPLGVDAEGSRPNADMKRRPLQSGVQPGEAIPPMEMLTQRLSHMVHEAATNNARKRLIRALHERGTKAADGGDLVRRVPKSGDNVITFMNHGTEEHWRINDPSLYSGLQFRPSTMVPLLSSLRHISQEIATNKGNPAFKPVTYGYDVLGSLVMNNRGRGLGILDEVLGHISGGRFTTGGRDPTVALSIVPAAMKKVWAHVNKAASEGLDRSLRRNGRWVATLGEDSVRSLRDVMHDAYVNSTVGKMRQSGAESAMLWRDVGRSGMPEDLATLSPAYAQKYGSLGQRVRANEMKRGVDALFNLFGDAVRVQMYGANVPRQFGRGTVNIGGVNIPMLTWRAKPTSVDEASRLANDVRRVTGDPSQKAGDVTTKPGKFISAVNESVPFANTAIQGTAQLARAFWNNPMRTSTQLGGLGAIGWGMMSAQIDDNPMSFDHYVNQMTPDQRAQYFPLYDPTTGKPSQVIKIPSEFRPFWSAFVEGTLSLVGYRNDNPLWAAGMAAWDSAMRDWLPYSGTSRQLGSEGPLSEPEINRTTRPGERPGPTDYMWHGMETILGASINQVRAGATALMDGLTNGEAMGDIARRMTAPYVHRAYEPGMGGAMLFPSEALDMKQSLASPVADAYNERRRAIQDIYEHASAGERPNVGVERPRAGQEGLLHTFQLGLTPEEMNVAASADMALKALRATGLDAQIADRRRQLDAINGNQAFDPATRRQRENEVRRELQGLYAQALSYIERIEHEMSVRMGREVTFEDMRP